MAEKTVAVTRQRWPEKTSAPPPAKTFVERWRDGLAAASAASAAAVAFAAWSDDDPWSLAFTLLYAASCAIRSNNPIAWGSAPCVRRANLRRPRRRRGFFARIFRGDASRRRRGFFARIFRGDASRRCRGFFARIFRGDASWQTARIRERDRRALRYCVVSASSAFSCPLADQLVSHVGESAFGLLMGRYAAATGAGGYALPLLICVVARAACWRGVYRAAAGPHALEETCWLVVASTLAARGFEKGHLDVFLFFFVYALGLAVWDLPMYLYRSPVNVSGDAVRASLTKPRVDVRFKTWRDDIPWLTVYFVVGPWMGLILRRRIVAVA